MRFSAFGVGNYYYMTHWNDMVNHTAVLTVEDAAFANQGIYSASYVGDIPLHGAWMRLIVRGLLDPDIHTFRHTHTHPHTDTQTVIYKDYIKAFTTVFPVQMPQKYSSFCNRIQKGT